jgi:CPA2 family monovalent cation:H+ antiporter-2
MLGLAPVVLILLCAVLVVTICRMTKIPPMLGYLAVGFLVGPAVLGLIARSHSVDLLGEIGIVFMMFSIGLEFSLSKLRAMRHVVFGLGLGQVGATLLALTGLLLVLGYSFLASFAVAAAFTMSSTAIASKLLSERNELTQRHGQMAMGVLLFQDLAVVPLLIILPALAGEGATLWQDLGWAVLKILLALVMVFTLGKKLIRPWFHLIARQHSSELFMVNVLLVTLGVALVTESLGLSMALGAFLAGMLISETEYRYQVEEDIRPFRDILLGFFFITIGMKIEFEVITHHYGLILGLLAGLLVVKFAVIAALGKALDYGVPNSMKAAFCLAPAGEFGFVLLALAAGSANLLSDELAQSALAAILFSMLLAPFFIQYAHAWTRRFAQGEWMQASVNLHEILVKTMQKNEHVLICGYGRSGQMLARILEAEKINFFALDLNPERVKAASSAGDSVVFGDAAKKEVLIAAGILRAKALVVTFSDAHSSMHITQVIRGLAPDLPIMIRTSDNVDVAALREAGADEVICDAREGMLMMASQVMMELGRTRSQVARVMQACRVEHYRLFQGFFSADDGESEDGAAWHLDSVSVTADDFLVGKTLTELNAHGLPVKLKSVRRGAQRAVNLSEDFRVQVGDVLVLLGHPEQLDLAKRYVIEGAQALE